jgi:hypothetical protein
MERARSEFRVLYGEYTIEQLIRWYNEDFDNPPQRGRRRTFMDWFRAAF